MNALYAALAVLALMAGAYWLGGRDDRAAERLETLQREGAIQDAIQTSNDSPDWRDLLSGRE